MVAEPQDLKTGDKLSPLFFEYARPQDSPCCYMHLSVFALHEHTATHLAAWHAEADSLFILLFFRNTVRTLEYGRSGVHGSCHLSLVRAQTTGEEGPLMRAFVYLRFLYARATEKLFCHVACHDAASSRET